jgi:hypothetical protein
LTEADLSETRITGTYRPLWEDREEAGKSGTEALLETAEGGQPWPRGKERQAPATSGFTVALSVAKAVLAATLLQGSGVEAATTEEGRQRRG